MKLYLNKFVETNEPQCQKLGKAKTTVYSHVTIVTFPDATMFTFQRFLSVRPLWSDITNNFQCPPSQILQQWRQKLTKVNGPWRTMYGLLLYAFEWKKKNPQHLLCCPALIKQEGTFSMHQTNQIKKKNAPDWMSSCWFAEKKNKTESITMLATLWWSLAGRFFCFFCNPSLAC